MQDGILLLTKDAMCKEYLPVYGNKIWAGKTPNIDKLAENGTVFHHHITAAPSTVMAFRSMMTGKFPFEQPYMNYTPKEVPAGDNDFFSIAKTLGYECHLMWDSTWVNMVLRYGNCFGKDTIIHNLEGIKQGVGAHYNRKSPLITDEKKAISTIDYILHEVEAVCHHSDKVCLWIHLPHVINGRTAYGSDIDLFDTLIGKLMCFFPSNSIFISADHGNMNGYNSKFCYGFDVNTCAVEIPLITPRLEGIKNCFDLTSNVDIASIIFDKKIIKRNIVYSDTAYYAQPQRKLVIYRENFAYIFEKASKKEFLYDIENDHNERCNLLENEYNDPDRNIKSPVREYYYSPYWEQIPEILINFRNEKDKIWRNASKSIELKEAISRKLKNTVVKIKTKMK